MSSGHNPVSGLKCVCLNARSLVNKMGELRLMVEDVEPDIIGITETWTRPDMGNAEFSLKGYQMFRKDREVRRGGGVALYIKQSIQAYEFQINNVVDYDEAIWCNILIRGAKLTVGVVYRRPSTSKEQDVILHNVISHVSRNDCVIMGDFNHADIRWNSLDSCDDGKAFLMLVQYCFLTQHVSEPTRGDNILDLILSTQKEMIDNVRVVEPLGKSDHSQIQFNLRVKTVNKGTKQKRRDFQKGDYDGMRQYAHNKKWKLLLKNKKPEQCWGILKQEFDYMITTFVPFKRHRRSRKKHLSNKALQKIRNKQRLWKLYRTTGNNDDYIKYKEALNATTKEIRSSKRMFEQKLATNIKQDSKSFFAYIRSKQRVKDSIGPLKGNNGAVISNNKEMAESLNEYFSTVFTLEDINALPATEQLLEEGKTCLEQLVVTPGMIEAKIKGLKDNKSPGADGISPRLLKEIVDDISVPLAIAFNLSIQDGIVPREWKNANIIPIFKKGSRCKSENYRPVSLTSVICKLLESLLRDHMVDFLTRHNLINQTQHGFLKGRSCLTNLLDFMEHISKWADDGSPVDVIYLDFQKAFDKVPHQRLLIKLKSHGMGESVVNWVRDWLSGRKQRVVVEGEESSWRPVISGVPQGSVLGPILFLIYINDLENEIGSNILKFADDTKMFRRVESQEDRHQLQSDLNKLVKWAEKWQMLFNKDKCKCLHIGQANAKNNYIMNNTVLLSTEREKDVGVVVSSDMKVSEQCGIAARKGNQILGLIRRNIAYRDKRLIIPLYMSLVRPHLEYCIQAWRPHMRKDIDKLERVQRRATRLISEISQLSYEERLQQCRLTTLETRRIRGDQIEVFKIMHGYEGLNKDMFFRIKNDSITRGHSLALVKSHSRLDIRKYTFSQRVVNDWNKLPEECINATSVNMFKNKIDQYYLKTRRE